MAGKWDQGRPSIWWKEETIDGMMRPVPPSIPEKGGPMEAAGTLSD